MWGGGSSGVMVDGLRLISQSVVSAIQYEQMFLANMSPDKQYRRWKTSRSVKALIHSAMRVWYDVRPLM